VNADSVDDVPAVEDFSPYRGVWDLADARRYFARPERSLSVSLLADRADGVLRWREVSFAVGAGVTGMASVALPVSQPVTRGVVLAHGGSDDGRRSFVSEAAALASRGATVILPVTRMRLDGGVDAFATDVKNAVLTERAALDVLVHAGAPPGALSFLGHSAGGALAAILCAVEPRLARVAILANGAGSAAGSRLAGYLSRGSPVTDEVAVVTDWFDLGHFVGAERRAELLVQHGRTDRTAPIEAGRALFDAAARPKRWVEYDCDHGLDADPQARRDRADFVMSTSPSY
jgi:predicted esterase